MSHLVPLGEVLASFQIDLPDVVILRKIRTAENDARKYLPSDDRPTVPTLNLGPLPVTVEAAENEEVITFESTVRSQANLRFEGVIGNDNEPFWASVEIPDADSHETATVETSEGIQVDERFTIAVSEDGLTVTLNTTGMESDMTIHSMISYGALFSDEVKEAVVNLVRISLNVDGLLTERSGDYTETRMDPADERHKIFSRLVYVGSGSLVA